MAIDEREAVGLAALLSEGLACTNARERLLCVAEVLMRLTDADHPLSNADIRAVLRARFGEFLSPSENTLAADLHALAHSGALGLAVHVTPEGYWCERTQLSPAKVRLLLNAVQSSRFLTDEQSAELQEDLLWLVSSHQEYDLAGEVLVDQRVRRDYQQVFAAIDSIAGAMRLGRKVEFGYTYVGFDGRAHVLAGDDGSRVRRETPTALYYADGSYYAETYAATPWRHGEHLMVSRVDRMVDVRVSSEPADACREVHDARHSAARRMAASFDMVPGTARRVFLQVKGYMTNMVYDRFGFGVRFGQLDDEAGGDRASALTLVQVPQVGTFSRWLAAAGEGIVMVEPPDELVLRTGPWARELREVTREELVADYEAMVGMHRAYLRRAWAPYGEGSSL